MILTATGFLRHEELKKRRIEAKILRHHSTVCQAVRAGGGGFLLLMLRIDFPNARPFENSSHGSRLIGKFTFYYYQP
jgi:hypothetical protein